MLTEACIHINGCFGKTMKNDIFGMSICSPIHRYQICLSQTKLIEIRGCPKGPPPLPTRALHCIKCPRGSRVESQMIVVGDHVIHFNV